jgi:hypothetical protein
LLQDMANLEDDQQHRIATASFDEAGRIIFG